MDLQYLLWLQGLRESLPSAVETFFVVVSAIAASEALVVLPCLLYWCFDKRVGQRLVFSFGIGIFLNNLLKCIVCAYRPWIRSSDVTPTEAALEEATGYSFPSGHTQSASCLIGGLGWCYRKRSAILNVLCWVFVLLVAFSRNFLGVHTPQDVVVGLIEGIVCIALSGALLSWVDGGRSRDVTVLLFGLAALAGGTWFVLTKGYPVEYDAAGEVLVDPLKMQVDYFKAVGLVLAVILGWFLERRLLDFETGAHLGAKTIIVRLIVGFIVLAALHFAARPLLALGVDERLYQAVKYFLTIFAATFVSPAAFCAIERRGGKASSPAGAKHMRR